MSSTSGVARPKIVVLSTYVIHPAMAGGQLRVNRLAVGLSADYDVHVLVIDPDAEQTSTVQVAPGLLQTRVAPGQEYCAQRAALTRLAGVSADDVAATAYAASSAVFMSALQAAIADAQLVILAQPYLYPALRRASPQLPFVYDAQNAEWVMKPPMYAQSEIAAQLSGVVREVETSAVHDSVLVSYCSTQDREQLAELAAQQAWLLVPNGSDVFQTVLSTGAQRRARRDQWLAKYRAASGIPADVEHIAVFVGSLHTPNAEAVELIAQLASGLPTHGFVIVGTVGFHLRGTAIPPNVAVIGPQPDDVLQDLLASADVALNPMLSGGGTNLKLIQYFAAGVPVVSTPLGVRGIDAVDGRELLTALPGGFAAAIAAVLDDPAAADQRAVRARALAEARYDWGVLAREFAAAIAERIQ